MSYVLSRVFPSDYSPCPSTISCLAPPSLWLYLSPAPCHPGLGRQSTCPISSCCVTSNRTLTSAETQLPLPTIQGSTMLCALEGLSEMLYKKVLESCTNTLFSHCHWQSLFLTPVCHWQWDRFCEPHSYVGRVLFSSSFFPSLVPGWVQEHSTVTLLFYNSELGDKGGGSPAFMAFPAPPDYLVMQPPWSQTGAPSTHLGAGRQTPEEARMTDTSQRK